MLTGLATATFPDGSMPEVGDVVRVATNVFSAGQETTVRLLGAALQVLGERPDIQAQLRKDRSLLPNFIEEALRIESPVKGDFRLNRVPVNVGGVDLPAGTTVMVVQAAANRDPRRFEDPDHLRSGPQERPPAHLRSAAASTAAPARRWPVPRPGSRSSGCSTGRPTSGSTRRTTVRRMTAATNMFRRTSCAA